MNRACSKSLERICAKKTSATVCPIPSSRNVPLVFQEVSAFLAFFASWRFDSPS